MRRSVHSSPSGPPCHCIFLFSDTAPTQIYTLSLPDALPISSASAISRSRSNCWRSGPPAVRSRSEEHTSELQSRFDLVCRLLLEKKKNKKAEEQMVWADPVPDTALVSGQCAGLGSSQKWCRV